MKMRLFVAAATLALLTTPAFAEFWIVREGSVGPCRIVSVRPVDPKIIIVGGKVYATRGAAEKDLLVVCRVR
jgi:hypothetical protein